MNDMEKNLVSESEDFAAMQPRLSGRDPGGCAAGRLLPGGPRGHHGRRVHAAVAA